MDNSDKRVNYKKVPDHQKKNEKCPAGGEHKPIKKWIFDSEDHQTSMDSYAGEEFCGKCGYVFRDKPEERAETDVWVTNQKTGKSEKARYVPADFKGGDLGERTTLGKIRSVMPHYQNERKKVLKGKYSASATKWLKENSIDVFSNGHKYDEQHDDAKRLLELWIGTDRKGGIMLRERSLELFDKLRGKGKDTESVTAACYCVACNENKIYVNKYAFANEHQIFGNRMVKFIKKLL